MNIKESITQSTISKKISLFSRTLAYISLAFATLLPASLHADDTSIYTGVDIALCRDSDSYRFVFIVDNSGSITSNEFATIKATIDATAATVLSSGLEGVQLAVMQYGTNNDTREHGYNVTVPFTNLLSTATSWGRHFGTGTSLNRWFQDHLPGSLAEARRDNIYAPGNELDITDATNVQFVFFTDAARRTRGCCSMMVADSDDPFRGNALTGFGEYNALKNGTLLTNSEGEDIRAQFTVLNVATGGVDAVANGVEAALAASAAIASVGGEYTSDVEANTGDPDGSQTKPRRFISSSFDDPELSSRITDLVDEVIQEIRTTNFTQTAPAVTVNAFNRLVNRTELFYSLFSPTTSPRWDGNIKGYSLTAEEDQLLDRDGNEAVDIEAGTIKDTAVSFWSTREYNECDEDEVTEEKLLDNCTPTTDGAQAAVGAFRDNLTSTRTIYTQQRALESETGNVVNGNYSGGGIIRIEGDTEIEATLLGLDDSQNTGGESGATLDEVQLAFEPTSGTSFTYSSAADSLIFDDSGVSGSLGFNAAASTPYFEESGADVTKEHRFEFTFGQNATDALSSGADFMLVGIQEESDTREGGTQSITLAMYMTPQFRLFSYIPGSNNFSANFIGEFSEGDVFQFLISGSSTTYQILQNGNTIATFNSLIDRNDNALPAGTNFRGKVLGLESSFSGGSDPVIFQNFRLRQEGIGGEVVDTATTREQVLRWIAGENVFNENLFEATGEGNQFLPDSLHSQPRVITYGGTAEDPIDVLFHTTNMGSLHAINPENGSERWAYYPPELLENPLTYIRDDDRITNHQYGLDGDLSTWVVRTPGEIRPSRVFVYMGQRRGGKTIYGFNATNALSSTPIGSNTCDVIGDGIATDPICQLFPPIVGGTEANSTAGFEMLGQTWGRPTRLRINTDDPSFCGTGVDTCLRDVLLFVGGYDTQYDGVSQDCEGNDVGVASVEDLAGCVVGNHIYMVDAFTGDLIWSIGSTDPGLTGDLYTDCEERLDSVADDVIATNQDGTCNDAMEHSFVATPISLDLDRDGAIDTLFVNDISGQIWRIDFRSSDPDNRVFTRVIEKTTAGVIADLSSDDDGAQGRFFYNAIDASILQDSDITNGDIRLNLTIGSGNRANPRNSSESTGNNFYVIYDTNLNSPPVTYSYVAAETDADLPTQINLEDLPINTTTAGSITPFFSTHGFQVATEDSEFEKVLAPTVTLNGTALGVSYSPDINADSCTIGGSRLYMINLGNGEIESRTLAQPGIVSEAVVLNLLTAANVVDEDGNRVPQTIKTKICVGIECFDAEDDLDIEAPVDTLGKSLKKAWWEVKAKE